ncbi:MAG: methyltransferase domain-containing protein [Adlercreutzia sp.]
MSCAGTTTGLPARAASRRAAIWSCRRRSLVGARVVNVGCRCGKGTYKLSEQVGADGFVVGVDWSEAFVEAARAGVLKALDRSGLSRCNMAFRIGFPEDLAAAGIEEGWADFVYLNSSLSLFAAPARALRECCRVLVPGGVLLAEVPVAVPGGAELAAADGCSCAVSRGHRRRRDGARAARALPNAVQAAPTFEELLAWLAAAGFSGPTVRSERPLSPEEGSTPDRPAATVPGDAAAYRLLSLEVAR